METFKNIDKLNLPVGSLRELQTWFMAESELFSSDMQQIIYKLATLISQQNQLATTSATAPTLSASSSSSLSSSAISSSSSSSSSSASNVRIKDKEQEARKLLLAALLGREQSFDQLFATGININTKFKLTDYVFDQLVGQGLLTSEKAGLLKALHAQKENNVVVWFCELITSIEKPSETQVKHFFNKWFPVTNDYEDAEQWSWNFGNLRYFEVRKDNNVSLTSEIVSLVKCAKISKMPVRFFSQLKACVNGRYSKFRVLNEAAAMELNYLVDPIINSASLTVVSTHSTASASPLSSVSSASPSNPSTVASGISASTSKSSVEEKSAPRSG